MKEHDDILALINSKFDALNVRLDTFDNKLDILGVGVTAIKTKVDTLENVPLDEIKTSLSDLMGAVLNN